MLTSNGITEQEQKQHPQAAVDVVNFFKDNAEKDDDDAVWTRWAPRTRKSTRTKPVSRPRTATSLPSARRRARASHGTARTASRTHVRPRLFPAATRHPSRHPSSTAPWFQTARHPDLRALAKAGSVSCRLARRRPFPVPS
jgi:p21-activated kinase 1